MAAHSKKLLQLLLVVSLLAATKTQPMSKSNCPTNCGSVPIPFPFGTTEDCSLDPSFLITCNQTSSSSHTPFLPQTDMTVLTISLDGELRVSWPVASDCYAARAKLVNETGWDVDVSPFMVKSSRNKFTVIGCDTLALAVGVDWEGKNYTTGCLSLCNRLDDIVVNGSCSGIGCCETSIPEALQLWAFDSVSVYNHTHVLDFNPCGYAFLVEDGAYNFSSFDLVKFEETTFPVVLDWAVGNETCQEAQKNVSSYACKSDYSECYDSAEGGYLCNCKHGFWGNAYLLHGCQDVDECMETNDCVRGANCKNFIGSYNCSCPKGHEGDGKKKGSGCKLKSKNDFKRDIILIGVFSSLGSIILLLGLWWLYKVVRQKIIQKHREKFFKQNGGLLLKQRLSSGEVSVDKVKLFSLRELEKATHHFNVNRILGKGGQGTVYKGMLTDGKIVAVKKFKVEGNVKEFINEFVILSQINHRNVVKLLGSCLETEIPLLVYEFISNGNLFEYLHEQNEELLMTWDMRLRIATEIAAALFYLHSAASQPIYHRDIKSTNILLDEKYRAKVADFGTSRMVSIEATHLTTVVQGTFGYLDPEYFHTSQFTEKSDVYSFGVVLVELLTGQKPISSLRPQEAKSLASYFILCMEENCLFDIIDERVMKEGKKEHIIAVANLASRCLELNGKKRPTMKEIALELEGIQKFERKSDTQENNDELELARIEDYQSWATYSMTLNIEPPLNNNAPTLEDMPIRWTT